MALFAAFDRCFDSPIDLPMPVCSGPADVSIAVTRSDRATSDAFRAWREDEVLRFDLDGIRYDVTGGARVDIDVPRDADDDMVRLWLTGTVLAGLLAQQGRLVLHANGLLLPDGSAALVIGESGAGKSTLAAQWAASGRPMMCDDLAALEMDGEPRLLRGLDRVKLWSRDRDLLDPNLEARPIAAEVDKVELRPGTGELPERAAIKAIYLLEKGEPDSSPLIEPLQGAAAAAALVDNNFRWEVGQLWHEERWQFERCVALANAVPVYRFTRPWDRDRRDESFAALLGHLGA